MRLRTCLVLSEDPDHHVEIAEAMGQASEEVVVLITTQPDSVLKILSERSLRPELLIIDLTISGLDPDLFLEKLEAKNLHQDLLLILYGESEDHPHFQHPSWSFALSGDITYLNLRKVLRTFINGRSTLFVDEQNSPDSLANRYGNADR